MLPRISRVECHDADYLLFSTDDYISVELYKTGRWGGHIVDIARLFVEGVPGSIVADVGANLGTFSIPLAGCIKDAGGTVFGFEPQRIVYYQLCGNIFINRLDNCHAVNSIVGDFDGMREIPEIDYQNNSNVGAFSLEKKFRELHGIEQSMKRKSHLVSSISLNNFNFGGPLAVLKIDVEGFELSVLKGARKLLSESEFPPIFFEAWKFDWFRGEWLELMNFVRGLGYSIENIGGSDYLAQHPNHVRWVKLDRVGGGIKFTRER